MQALSKQLLEEGKQHDLPYPPELLGLAPPPPLRIPDQQAAPPSPAPQPIMGQGSSLEPGHTHTLTNLQQQRDQSGLPMLTAGITEGDACGSHAPQTQHQGPGSAADNAGPAFLHAVEQDLPGSSAAVSEAARQRQAPGQEADAVSNGTDTTVSQAEPPSADAESAQLPDSSSLGLPQNSYIEPIQVQSATSQEDNAAEGNAQGIVVAWQPVADFPVHSITEVACMKMLPGFLQDMAQVMTDPCASRLTSPHFWNYADKP